MEIRTIQPFLQYLTSVRERTMRVARCIPPEKVEWTYTPGKFTLGDLLRHIAVTERYLFAENIQGQPSRYKAHGTDLADGLENIFEFMERLRNESLAIFTGLNEAQLVAKCTTPGGTTITTWKWLRLMAEHEIHHRGEIYVYLGLLEVPTPPLYGLSSEEVRARSGS